MKKTLLEIAPVAVITALVGALPTTAMAHAGVEQGSAVMLGLHALAHTVSDHPIILIVLIGALTGAYGLYRRGQRKSQAV